MRGVEPRRWVRVLRLLGWNALLLTIGLALIAAAGAWAGRGGGRPPRAA